MGRWRWTAATVAVATVVAGLFTGPVESTTAATVHVWALGDAARCPNGQPANPVVRDVVAVDDAPVLMLGDLVTPTGSTAEFTGCFDPVWGSVKPRMRPVPGNHEYQTPGAAGYFAYFDPIPAYYAWELNGWRFYALNSMCGYTGGCTTTGAQYRWLENQLRTHPGVCQVAYWHHPRWSQGGHGNVDKMAPVYELMVSYGVELLLVGHENGVYQRYPALDAAGRPSPRGVTEFVVSTGGVNDGAFEVVANPPSPLVRMDDVMGALRLDLSPTSWRAQFVAEAGESFTDTAGGTCFDETTTAPADTIAPTSTVTTPARDATVTSPVALRGSAADNVGVARVGLAIRNQATLRWLQADGTWGTSLRRFDANLASPGSPTSAWSSTRALPPGRYGVSVRATDTAGNVQATDTWVTFVVR